MVCSEEYAKFFWTLAEEEVWVSASFAGVVLVSQGGPRSLDQLQLVLVRKSCAITARARSGLLFGDLDRNDDNRDDDEDDQD